MIAATPLRRAGALALPLALLLAAPTPAAACSKVFLPLRTPRTIAALAVAASDTVLAGAGPVRYRVAAGHHAPGVERSIHGQLLDVARLDARSRALLPPGTARVVAVPWDYGADCEPTPWAPSARWTAPGADGLFVGELRAPEHWAGGVPTFDVHEPRWFPRPTRTPGQDGATGTRPLDAAELLALYEVVPTSEELARDAAAAVAPLRAWVRANPHLARRSPAAALFRMLRFDVEQRRVRALAPPMGGTYRLTVALDGAPPRTVWMRSWDHPTNGDVRRRDLVGGPVRPDSTTDPLVPDRSDAYHVVLVADTARAALPESAGSYVVPRSAYLRVALDSAGESGDPPWHGEIELRLLVAVFPSDSSLARFVDAAGDASFARHPSGAGRELPATFAVDADGTLRVEQRTTLADGRTLVLRGVRVDETVIRDVRPREP